MSVAADDDRIVVALRRAFDAFAADDNRTIVVNTDSNRRLFAETYEERVCMTPALCGFLFTYMDQPIASQGRKDSDRVAAFLGRTRFVGKPLSFHRAMAMRLKTVRFDVFEAIVALFEDDDAVAVAPPALTADDLRNLGW
jgi:hypothetical protein